MTQKYNTKYHKYNKSQRVNKNFDTGGEEDLIGPRNIYVEVGYRIASPS
jgi:hypothetical protein